MVRIFAIYNQPADPAAFDSYYFQTHVPLAKTVPGLRSMKLSADRPRALAGSAPYLIAELTFDSLEAVDAALASPEGQATAGDLANFAMAGVTLLIDETKEHL
jgi:uncharacterized protein (TIGR02118 family)